MDTHDIRHGYLRIDREPNGLSVAVVVTDETWTPTREFLVDTAADVRELYPGMDVVNVNWIRVSGV
jgi:hypothetical protein